MIPGAGSPQNLNRYSYVRNSPLRYTDARGHYIDLDAAKQGILRYMDSTGHEVLYEENLWSPALPIDPDVVENISGKYGQTEGYGNPHAGIDFNVKDEAEGVAAIYATHPGTVAYVKDAGLGGWGGGYGNAVWIKYEDPERGTLYIGSLHMYDTPSVSVGQEVQPGDQIGIVGNIGDSKGAHLHLEVRTPEAWSDNDNKPTPERGYPDADALYRDYVDPELIYPGLLDAYE